MGVAGNFRLSEFQASIALLNLRQFDEHQMNRMEMAQKYLDAFESMESEELLNCLMVLLNQENQLGITIPPLLR